MTTQPHGEPRRLHREGSQEQLLYRAFLAAKDPAAFHASWLALQIELIEGARAGLLVRASQGSDPGLEPLAVWPAGDEAPRGLERAARRGLEAGRGLALEIEGGVDEAPRPVVVQPIELAGGECLVAVLELAPEARASLAAALRRLVWGASWLELAGLRSQQGFGQQLETLVTLVATPLEHDRFLASAMAFVTDLATRLDCERASLGFVERGTCVVRAVSHSARFGERANLIRRITEAMEETLDQQERIHWPSRQRRVQITRAHEELAAASGAASVLSLPIARGDKFCGVLTLESAPGHELSEESIQVIQASVSLLGPMLEIQRLEDRAWYLRARDTAWKALAGLFGPEHLLAKVVTVILTAAILFMVLARGDYRVAADAKLEAEVLRAAVAPFDGFIEDAPRRAGDRVTEGEFLASLDARDLRLQQARHRGEIEQLTKEERLALSERDAAKARILVAQRDQARAQLDLVEAQLARTRALAPFDGFVVTGDLSQRIGAPVQRGDVLFEIAPLDAYRLVLEVDERDIEQIVPGQTGTMVFRALPSEGFGFELDQITLVSSTSDGQNWFRVEARLLAPSEGLRPGMEGVAKVEIGRRRLIWIWAHELLDWLRLSLWRWLP